LPIDPIEVTSTEVRELIANNEDVSALLDSDVYQFIKDQNLYKEQ
jgi:nicotinic acid mononucleotide adenylyltransferase